MKAFVDAQAVENESERAEDDVRAVKRVRGSDGLDLLSLAIKD